jgi:hypothetical protein
VTQGRAHDEVFQREIADDEAKEQCEDDGDADAAVFTGVDEHSCEEAPNDAESVQIAERRGADHPRGEPRVYEVVLYPKDCRRIRPKNHVHM